MVTRWCLSDTIAMIGVPPARVGASWSARACVWRLAAPAHGAATTAAKIAAAAACVADGRRTKPSVMPVPSLPTGPPALERSNVGTPQKVPTSPGGVRSSIRLDSARLDGRGPGLDLARQEAPQVIR